MPRQKRDPLIAAMIAKLPDGGEWPVEQQLAWIHLMAMALGVVHGGDAAARLATLAPGAPSANGNGLVPLRNPPPAAMLREAPKPHFYIDKRGFARNRDGVAINAKDVQGELVDLRGMDGDVKSIRWADGTVGLNGADLTIVAA